MFLFLIYQFTVLIIITWFTHPRIHEPLCVCIRVCGFQMPSIHMIFLLIILIIIIRSLLLLFKWDGNCNEFQNDIFQKKEVRFISQFFLWLCFWTSILNGYLLSNELFFSVFVPVTNQRFISFNILGISLIWIVNWSTFFP